MAIETSTRPLRADAVVNRDRILAAARDAFVERGPAAPLDDIARRAGTGIATLYRRFPDRESLMRAVVLDALERTADAAKRTAQEADPFQALVRYMHAALDIRVAAVIPALLEELPLDDDEMRRARSAGSDALQRVVDAAHDAGTLRPDITTGDIGILIIRMSRPLPGPFSREINDRLAHRHLDLLMTGLRTRPGRPARLAGPALTLPDLQQMSATDHPAAPLTGRASRGRR